MYSQSLTSKITKLATTWEIKWAKSYRNKITGGFEHLPHHLSRFFFSSLLCEAFSFVLVPAIPRLPLLTVKIKKKTEKNVKNEINYIWMKCILYFQAFVYVSLYLLDKKNKIKNERFFRERTSNCFQDSNNINLSSLSSALFKVSLARSNTFL